MTEQPGKRSRRDREDIRELILEAAINEFASKGFEGASTRAIATAADAHQPQIMYHFGSKDELWREVVSELFARLAREMRIDKSLPPRVLLPRMLRRWIVFTAENPALIQLMSHEAGTPSPRLTWLVDRHSRVWYELLSFVWEQARAEGLAAPIDADLIHHVVVGATSLIYQSSAEAEILLGQHPSKPEVVERLVEGLTAMLLPGLSAEEREAQRAELMDPAAGASQSS